MNYITGIIYILHGLVHLLYMGHSLNYFELEKEFSWPGKSRFLRNVFKDRTERILAAAFCLLAAAGFVLSGVFSLTGHHLQKFITLVAVFASTLLFVAFWDGTLKKLPAQGGIALLINSAILAYMLLIAKPQF